MGASHSHGATGHAAAAHAAADAAPEKSSEEEAATSAIAALQTLQKTLHQLTPAQQWEVKRALPFATTEWQQGMSLSLNPVKTAFGESVHGLQHFGRSDGPQESAAQKRIRLTPDASKVILVLVGLPARGKSMYGAKIEQFLSWRGYKVKSFKVGAWRRGERDGKPSPVPERPSPSVARRGLAGLANHAAKVEEEQRRRSSEPKVDAAGTERSPHSSASFFDSKKAYAAASREKASIDCFGELLSWMEDERGQVAIFDAANVTIARRAKLTEMTNRHMRKHPASAGISLVFIESICTDAEIVHRSMIHKCKLSSDFKGMRLEEAMSDLASRIAHYEPTYETVREAEGSYIKIFDMRAKVHVCNVYGRMAKSVLPFIMALHTINRPIFLLSVDENAAPAAAGGGMGALAEADGQSALSDGLASWLAAYPRAHELLILSSTQPKALGTANALAGAAGAASPLHRAQLAPLERAQELDPQSDSPLPSFRKAFGERVADLVTRLEPVALEMEGCTAPVLVLAHEGACRTLRAFLLPEAARKSMSLRETVDGSVKMASNTLLEFTPAFEGGPMVEKVHVL